MKKQNEELRKIAEKATPGPWYRGPCLDGVEGDGTGSVAVCMQRYPTRYQEEYDAEYIAAANPKTVLRLLDRIDYLSHAGKCLIESLEDPELSNMTDLWKKELKHASEDLKL